MKIKVKMNPVSVILAERNLQKGGPGQRFAVHEVRRVSDAYVPFLNGPLKNTAIETTYYIKYIAPYAKKQYNENKGKGLRGKHWDKRAFADRGREVLVSIAKFVGGKPK